MKAIVNPIMTISTRKNFMLGFVNIFMLRFRSRINRSRAKGAQYTTTRITCDVAKAKPIIEAGASKVYRNIGVSKANYSIVPSW